jgi:hypothetical protein
MSLFAKIVEALRHLGEFKPLSFWRRRGLKRFALSEANPLSRHAVFFGKAQAKQSSLD